MLRRHILATAALSVAAPTIVLRQSLGQNLRKVKMGSAFTTTTNAAFLMPALLKPEGIDLELVMFPSLVQRMQAVASGDVDIGNGGLSATMQVATKGFPMQVLANGCDGGWMVLAQPSVTGWKDLVGKKIAVQNGSIGLVVLIDTPEGPLPRVAFLIGDDWRERIAPVVEDIANEKGDALHVAKLNIDDNPGTAQRYGVMSIPTLILFKDGQETARIVGAQGKERILAQLDQHL